jgi:hypothetical protein
MLKSPRTRYNPYDYTVNAFASIASLVDFIEDKNTAGEGLRFLQL